MCSPIFSRKSRSRFAFFFPSAMQQGSCACDDEQVYCALTRLSACQRARLGSVRWQVFLFFFFKDCFWTRTKKGGAGSGRAFLK